MDQRIVAPPSLSIGYYSPGWPVAAFANGIVTYIGTLVPPLEAMGHQVTIVAGRVPEETSNGTVYNVQQVWASRSLPRRAVDGLWHRVAPRLAYRQQFRWRLSRTVKRAVAERGIQIIEMEESFGWARWLRAVTSIPVCVRLHGPWLLSGRALAVPEDDAFHERVRDEGLGILAANAVTRPPRCSGASPRLLRTRAAGSRSDTECHLAGTPAERWRLEECDPKQVVFIGRFDRLKGGDLIIEAFGRVLHDVPDARLLFVGPDRGYTDGDGRRWGLEDFVRDRIPGALETDRIRCMGQQPFSALAEFRRKAMVSVACSRYESFSYTVIEAMALGCPTIGANAGGIAEILDDGVNGLLHRVGDPSDIAAKIIDLLKSPGRAAELGRQAAADCERRYYPEVVAAKLVEFYRRVISRAPHDPKIGAVKTAGCRRPQALADEIRPAPRPRHGAATMR